LSDALELVQVSWLPTLVVPDIKGAPIVLEEYPGAFRVAILRSEMQRCVVEHVF